MVPAFHPYLPIATLVALTSLMAFAPKIGPVVLVAAALVAALPAARTVYDYGLRGPLARLRESERAGRDTLALPATLAVFALYGTASLAWIPEADFALSRAARLTGFLALAVFYGLALVPTSESRRADPGRAGLVAAAGYGAAAMCMVLSFVVIVPNEASPDGFVNRAVVVFVLAAFASAAHVLATPWPGTLRRALAAAAFAAAAAMSLFSNSQASTVALACGLIAALVAGVAGPAVRKGMVWALAATGLAMPALVAAVSALPAAIFDLPFLRQGSAADRLAIWRSYLELVRERPLLGWGLEGSREFDAALLADPSGPEGGFRFTLHPHNAFLQMWTDLGAIGALVFCGVVVLAGLRIERLQPAARAPVYGLFAGILATAAVSHGAFQSWWMASIAVLAVSVLPLTQKPNQR